MKSNSISTTSVPKGMGDVPRPRAVTYSGTCQLWLTQGVRDNLTLPTIWVHRCKVAAVSRQLKYGRSGHTAGSAPISVLHGNQGLIREHTRSARQSAPHAHRNRLQLESIGRKLDFGIDSGALRTVLGDPTCSEKHPSSLLICTPV